MARAREVNEGRQVQGIEEAIAYSVTTTPWGTSPDTVVVKAYNITAGSYTEVTETVLSGSSVISGDVITLPKLGSLTAGLLYRIEVKFNAEGNTFEFFFEVKAER